MLRLCSILILTLALLASAVPALSASLTVNTSAITHPISPVLYGVFFEEISHAGVGGLYAQLINNSNFESDICDFFPWTAIPTSSVHYLLSLNTDEPLTWQSPTSLQIRTTAQSTAAPQVGIANPGFWGIPVVNSTGFTISLYAYSPSSSISAITAALVSRDGQTTYGSLQLGPVTRRWTQLTGLIRTSPSIRDDQAVLTLTWSAPGPVDVLNVDVVTLFPVAGWKDLPFIRADLGAKVEAMKPSFIRMPGGGYIVGDVLRDRFNWKRSLGNLTERTGHFNPWKYWSEDMLGAYEYAMFAERLTDAQGEPTRVVWVINPGIGNQDFVRAENIGGWIQDALDSVEFLTGNTSTKYGAIRASMGHPEPFRLDYLAIGNENCQFGGMPHYEQVYPLFYQTIKAAYPNLPLIANCNDTHLGTFDLYEWHDYPSAATMWSRRTFYDDFLPSQPVFVSEYAARGGDAGAGNLRAAVAEAGALNSMERSSEWVRMASYAPLFGNVNALSWTPNAIQFNVSASYGTPSYWNNVIYAGSFAGVETSTLNGVAFTADQGDVLSVSVTRGKLTAEYSRLTNGSTDVFIVKMANFGANDLSLDVALTDLPTTVAFPATSQLTQLRSSSGNPADENSLAVPTRVVPGGSGVSIGQSTFSMTLPAWSVNVLRVYCRIGQRGEDVQAMGE